MGLEELIIYVVNFLMFGIHAIVFGGFFIAMVVFVIYDNIREAITGKSAMHYPRRRYGEDEH